MSTGITIRTVSTLTDLTTEEIKKVKKGCALTCYRHLVVKVEKEENGNKSSEIKLVALSCFARFFTQIACLRKLYLAWQLSIPASRIKLVPRSELDTVNPTIKKTDLQAGDSSPRSEKTASHSSITVNIDEDDQRQKIPVEGTTTPNQKQTGESSPNPKFVTEDELGYKLFSPSYQGTETHTPMPKYEPGSPSDVFFSPKGMPMVEGEVYDSPMVKQVRRTPLAALLSPTPPYFKLVFNETKLAMLKPEDQRVLKSIAFSIDNRKQHGPVILEGEEFTEGHLTCLKGLVADQDLSALFPKQIPEESVLYRVIVLFNEERTKIVGCKVYPEAIDFAFEKVGLYKVQTVDETVPELKLPKELKSPDKNKTSDEEKVVVSTPVEESVILPPAYKMELTAEELMKFDEKMQEQLLVILQAANTCGKAPVLIPSRANVAEALKKLGEEKLVSGLDVVFCNDVINYSFIPDDKYLIQLQAYK